MTRLELAPLALEFRTPLRTARGAYARREGFVLRVHEVGGAVGQGEAMPLPEFGTESLEACGRALREACAALQGASVAPELAAITAALGTALPSAARHALELALLDLGAQARGESVARWLSPTARDAVEVNALLGASEPGALAAEARDAVQRGFRTLKVKVGRADDVARLSVVREAVGSRVCLRVDANGAWSADEALEALAGLQPLGLELCEQPVAADDLAGFRRVAADSACRLAADESLAVPDALEALLAERVVDVLVLKPMVLGGLLPALALARRASARGLEAYVTSSLDGVVARAGAAQLAAALPSGALASGLAVGHLFVGEPVHAYSPVQGRIPLPPGPGLGLEPPR
nr:MULTISPECIES: o-succinylbenzoate synthase [Myxococcaceae]